MKCEAVTAEEKFYQHDVVFVGELEKGPEEWKASVNFPKKSKAPKRINYDLTFKVLKTIKGNPKDKVAVASYKDIAILNQNSDGTITASAYCHRLVLHENKAYLVFVSKEDGRYRASLCCNNFIELQDANMLENKLINDLNILTEGK